MDLKGEIDNNTVIVGDLNTPLSAMGRSSGQKINKETLDLNHTLEQMTHIYRTFYPAAEEYTFFPHAYGTFSGIDRMIEHRNISEFKKIEILSTNFCVHDGMKVEMNKRKVIDLKQF